MRSKELNRYTVVGTSQRKLLSILFSAALLFSRHDIAVAGEIPRSDSLIEAARYVQKAEEELNCSTAQSSKWVSTASNVLGQYRSVSQTDSDTAAMLRVRIAFLQDDIEGRQKALKQAANDSEKLLTAKRLSSAQRVIQNVTTNTPTCDARFRQWEFEITQGLREAERLVRAGDERLNIDPKQALRLYEAAIAINVEETGMAARVASARSASRRAHTVVKKVFWITITTALAGAAAYEGEQYYKQHQRQAASSAGTNGAVTVISPK